MSAPFGDDRKQAGKRSDMKHCLFLGVFPVTRNSLSNGCVLEYFGPRCIFVFWSNASVI